MALESSLPFLIIGPGGSGVSSALDMYADFGYLTLAGVDPAKLDTVVLPLLKTGQPVAFSLRVEPEHTADMVNQRIAALRQAVPTLKILTLTAPEDTLVQRYLQSEKPHAYEASSQGGLQAAVAAEKAKMASLQATKDYSIDTSTTTTVELRHKIAKVLGRPVENQEFTVYINTFGFKYGAPQDAELMFDMRFMTNPFYDENLRPMTGKDKPVRDFIFGLDHARRFFENWSVLVAEMLPLYRAEGKTRLTIAVGCTGGKHRSVCMGEALALHLKQTHPDFHIVINHREMLRWGKVAEPTLASLDASSPVQPAPQQSAPTCPVGEPS